MKKFIFPIILLFVVVSLNTFEPELNGIRTFIHVALYSSLLRILIFKTNNLGKVTNTLLKWTLGIGLILPIFLIKADLLIFDQFYIADIIILVPIFFHELMLTENKLSVEEKGK